MENRIKSEAKFWNSVATKFDGVVEKRFPEAYKFIFEHLAEDVEDSKNLLEIATGTGIVAIKLSNQVPRITAIDIAPQMLEVAKKKCSAKQIDNITFKFGDACALEFGDKTFDTIIASNVVHLLYEPEMAFREMKRVLKDQGKLLYLPSAMVQTFALIFYPEWQDWSDKKPITDGVARVSGSS